MSNFIGIRSQLETIITAIMASAGIASLYDYNPIELGSTPAVLILHNTSGEEINNTDETELTVSYIIRVIVEGTNDRDTQTTKLLTLTDAIMAELRKDDNETLSGNCHYFLAEHIESPADAEFAEMPVMFQDIVINAKILKSISSP